MADLSITATQVVAATSGATFVTLPAGAAITAGQVCYKKASDGKAYLADANVSATEAAATGIAVGPAVAAGQYVTLQTSGTVTIGAAASITAGATYWVSATAGGICPEADLTTGYYVTYLGTGNASNQIVLGIQASGVAHA